MLIIGRQLIRYCLLCGFTLVLTTCSKPPPPQAGDHLNRALKALATKDFELFALHLLPQQRHDFLMQIPVSGYFNQVRRYKIDPVSQAAFDEHSAAFRVYLYHYDNVYVVFDFYLVKVHQHWWIDIEQSIHIERAKNAGDAFLFYHY